MKNEKKPRSKAQKILTKKIIEENVPYSKKAPLKVEEAQRTSNRLDQKRQSYHHIIIKTLNVQNKERILKTARKKDK